jgi:hypothetical protein
MTGAYAAPVAGIDQDLATYQTLGSSYTGDSAVTFTCRLDNTQLPCESQFANARLVPPSLARVGIVVGDGPGWFEGQLGPAPGLASGMHTFDVTATDEDGSSPSPTAVTFRFDGDRPPRTRITGDPGLIADRHPEFVFTGRDESEILRMRAFVVKLTKAGDGSRTAELHNARCRNARQCRAHFTWRNLRSFTPRKESVKWIGREGLRPGRYVLRVKTIDAGGNTSSEWARHDFRVISKRAR